MLEVYLKKVYDKYYVYSKDGKCLGRYEKLLPLIVNIDGKLYLKDYKIAVPDNYKNHNITMDNILENKGLIPSNFLLSQANVPGSNPGGSTSLYFNFDNILSNKSLKGTDYNKVYEILSKKTYKDIDLEKYLSDDILEKFKDYLITKGIFENWKVHIYRIKKYLPLIVKDNKKLIELDLEYRTLSGIVTAIKYFKDFLFENYGIELQIDIQNLRTLIKPKRKEEISLAEYFDKSIINEAISILKNSKTLGLKTRIYLLVLFFTGLRASEVNYFLNNLRKIKNVIISNSILFELNYNRKTKKAYLTILPSKLFKKLSEINISYKFSNAFRDKLNRKGIKTYVFRKSFIAIASNTMMNHEIDLLQGRINSILIRHYVRHIPEIVKKYEKAFEQYYNLIDEIIDEI